MGTSFDRSADLLEFGLSLGPVSCNIVHVIVALGLGEFVLKQLLRRPSGLNMISAELDATEFGVCPVVTQVP